MYSVVRAVIRHKHKTSAIIDIQLGVKQGDPNSSSLFMLFVNYILENINSNLDSIFTINEIKLYYNVRGRSSSICYFTNITRVNA